MCGRATPLIEFLASAGADGPVRGAADASCEQIHAGDARHGAKPSGCWASTCARKSCCGRWVSCVLSRCMVRPSIRVFCRTDIDQGRLAGRGKAKKKYNEFDPRNAVKDPPWKVRAHHLYIFCLLVYTCFSFSCRRHDKQLCTRVRACLGSSPYHVHPGTGEALLTGFPGKAQSGM